MAMDAQASEIVGVRPRGMLGRQRHYPATIQFSDFAPSDWKVSGQNSGDGTISRTREQLLWEEAVAALGYRGKSDKSIVTYEPPEPVRLPDNFDAVEVWMKGGVVGWAKNTPETPRILPFLRIIDGNGETHQFDLYQVDFPWWYAMFKELDVKKLPRPLKLVSIGLAGCSNSEEKTLYLDSLCFFKQDFADKLDLPTELSDDFITTPSTIVPLTPAAKFVNSVRKDNSRFIFIYDGDDEKLEWVIDPAVGSFDGISVRFPDGKTIKPCAGGGPVSPQGNWNLASAKLDGETVTLRYTSPRISVENALVWQCSIKAKSLILQLTGGQRCVERISLGHLEGPDAVAHFVPYLTVTPIITGPKVGSSAGRFVTVLPCWYTSNASVLLEPGPNTRNNPTALAGDTIYRPIFGGGRNALSEKIVLTVSSRFDEVIPTIPHRPSPMRKQMIDRVVLYEAFHPIAEWQKWLRLFKYLKRKGVDKLFVFHHSQTWADDDQGPQEWTMTAHAAPAIGDGNMRKYLRVLQDLDYHPVFYTNYTDMQPVSPEFEYDKILRMPDGKINRQCWPGSYPIKPLVGMKLEEKYAPLIRKNFGVRGALVDVHSALPPWGRVDYDSRAPGAGAFHICYLAWVHTILNDKRNYDGPIIGEGAHRVFYAGITDYDAAELAECWNKPCEHPWLVDFDLLRLHSLHFGVGMSSMPRFLPPDEMQVSDDPCLPIEERSLLGDPHCVGTNHYLAATIAYGHAGMLPIGVAPRESYHSSVRIYHLTQQLQQRYLIAAPTGIRYFDGSKLTSTEEAILSGHLKRNQLRIGYDSGLELAVNGHKSENWKVTIGKKTFELPPYGWVGQANDFIEYSALIDGHRADYVNSSEYVFFDSWGTKTDFGEVITDGAGRCAVQKGRLRLVVLGPYTVMKIRPAKLFKRSSESYKLFSESEDGTLTELAVNISDGVIVLPSDKPPFGFVIQQR